MNKQSEEREEIRAFCFGEFSSFFILYVPVHNFDGQPVRKTAVTLSREEAAQARLLDVRRILS